MHTYSYLYRGAILSIQYLLIHLATFNINVCPFPVLIQAESDLRVPRHQQLVGRAVTISESVLKDK